MSGTVNIRERAIRVLSITRHADRLRRVRGKHGVLRAQFASIAIDVNYRRSPRARLRVNSALIEIGVFAVNKHMQFLSGIDMEVASCVVAINVDLSDAAVVAQDFTASTRSRSDAIDGALLAVRWTLDWQSLASYVVAARQSANARDDAVWERGVAFNIAVAWMPRTRQVDQARTGCDPWWSCTAAEWRVHAGGAWW